MGRGLFIGAALLLFATSPVLAQTRTLSGTIVDASGAAVQGASVTLMAPSVRETAITDSNGEYRFRNVTPGTYQVSRLPGRLLSRDARQHRGGWRGCHVAADCGGGGADERNGGRERLESGDPAHQRARHHDGAGRERAGVDVGAEFRRPAAQRPRHECDSDLGTRHQSHLARGDEHARDLATGAARRPFDLSRFLRPHLVGLHSDQPRRHQADRSRARTGVRGMGSERADRSSEYHHEVATRGTGHDRHLQRRRHGSRRGIDQQDEAPAKCWEPRSAPRRS